MVFAAQARDLPLPLTLPLKTPEHPNRAATHRPHRPRLTEPHLGLPNCVRLTGGSPPRGGPGRPPLGSWTSAESVGARPDGMGKGQAGWDGKGCWDGKA